MALHPLATSRTVDCERCDGLGELDADPTTGEYGCVQCPNCEGWGWIILPAEHPEQEGAA